MPGQRIDRRALVAPILVLTIAACSAQAAAGPSVASLGDGGGTPASAEPGSSAGPSLSPEDQALAFARCMREQGIDMPDPQIGGNGGVAIAIGGEGIDAEKLQEAQEACSEHAPGGFGPGATLSPEQLDEMVEFAECMREHGVDMPDPTTSGGAVMIRIGEGGIDPNDPDFQQAQEACREVGSGSPGFVIEGPRGGGE